MNQMFAGCHFFERIICMKKKKSLWVETIITVIIAALCAYVFIASNDYKSESKLFPQVVSALTFVCSAAGILLRIKDIVKQHRAAPEQSAAEEAPSGEKAEEKKSILQRIPNHYLAMIGTILYAAALNPLGFILSTAAALLVLPRVFGYKNWKVIIPVALVFSLGLYFLFSNVFYIRLPAGVLKGIL